jgi:hypothetical protein
MGLITVDMGDKLDHCATNEFWRVLVTARLTQSDANATRCSALGAYPMPKPGSVWPHSVTVQKHHDKPTQGQ